MLYIDVITLFPQLFTPFLESGVTRRGFTQGQCHFQTWNPRDFTNDIHRTVDDRPYGGGPGMVMLAEPLTQSISNARINQQKQGISKSRTIYFSPHGKHLDHETVVRLSQYQGLILICGRYESIDQRCLDQHVDEEISLGDFVLSGGEIAAIALIDAMVRLLPGVLNHQQSAVEDSFVNGLLDCPHYTRPEIYQGTSVPNVLLSGNHAAIAKWRREESLRVTQQKRPDLIQKARHEGQLTKKDELFLQQLTQNSIKKQAD